MSRFQDAVGALLIGQPFFAQLLLKLKHVESTDIPTLGVNPTTLIYNPEFLDKMTIDEAVWCVAHEVMHHAWDHLPRIRHYIDCGVGPDGHKLDPQLFNMALDYPINDAITKGRVGTLPRAEIIKPCLDPKYPESMTPEEIYCDLRKRQQAGEKLGGAGGAGGMVLDEHDGTGSDGNTLPAITPADVVQAAQLHKSLRGEFPLGVDRLVRELSRPSQSPWRILRNFVTTSLSGYDSTSWRKLQRRMIVRRIGIPGRVQQGAGVIGIVADTSGSIGEEMLALFGSHMGAIIDDARPMKVYIYWTDARMHRRDEVKTSTDLRRLLAHPVPGGGGTDMPEGVRCAEEDACDAIVVLTDGYTPFCSSKKPLIWAITESGIEASGNGRSIHIS
jgi:predicted metal-dependent peptidase